mgnify:FL=1|jgi:hypothetical protein
MATNLKDSEFLNSLKSVIEVQHHQGSHPLNSLQVQRDLNHD